MQARRLASLVNGSGCFGLKVPRVVQTKKGLAAVAVAATGRSAQMESKSGSGSVCK